MLQDTDEEIGQLTVAITARNFGASASDRTRDIAVVIEGVEAIRGLYCHESIARSCSLLLGLTYALNLTYPKPMKYTYEAFPKKFLALDASKLSDKVQNKLLA